MRPPSVVILLASLLCACCARAQPQASPRVLLSGEVTLAQLVDLCSAQLRVNIDFDRSVLTGTVSLRLHDALSDTQLWDLTNRLLNSRGFSTVEATGSENSFSIVKLADAAARAPLERNDGGTEKLRAGFRSAIFQLTHIPPRDATGALQPIIGRDATLNGLADSPFLIVAGPTQAIEHVEFLLPLIDTPLKQPVVTHIPLEHTPAIDVVSGVNAIVAAAKSVSGRGVSGKLIVAPHGNAVVLVAPDGEVEYWRDLVDRFDEARTLETRSYAPRFFDAAEVAHLLEEMVRQTGSSPTNRDGWRVVTNEFTGALVVTATLQQHVQIEKILNELNTLPVETRRPIRTFPVKNRSVAELVELLAELVDAGALEPEPLTDPPALPSGTAVAVASSEQNESRRTEQISPWRSFTSADLRITADDATSSIIAIGEPRMLSQLEQLISTLDVRQPQVMLEVLIVSMSDGESFDLGVELRQMGITGDTLTSLTSLFGLSSTESDVTPSLSDPRGGTAVILNPGDFSVVVRALETINEGRSLNVPRVLVNNNEQATLDSVLQQPLLSVNASDTVATTSFGGTQDAGTQVAVTPQIAEGDHLLLEYTVTLSSFVGESSDPSLPPPRQQNTLASIATIPDGFVVAVGGLEVETEADAESKVPVLGDIPLVGEAFKNRSKSRTRSRFYVFIRPTILRHEGFADLRYISTEMKQQAMIADDTWPKVKPQIIF